MTLPKPSSEVPNNLAIPEIDEAYLIATLKKMLAIPSPSGYTENISRFVVKELESFGLKAELTRRGAIRAIIPGQQESPAPWYLTWIRWAPWSPN